MRVWNSDFNGTGASSAGGVIGGSDGRRGTGDVAEEAGIDGLIMLLLLLLRLLLFFLLLIVDRDISVEL